MARRHRVNPIILVVSAVCLQILHVPSCHGFALPRGISRISNNLTENVSAKEDPPGSSPLISANKSHLFASSDTEEKPSSSLANYHLLWSPRVWRNMLLSTISLWVALRAVPALNFRPNSVLLQTLLLPTLSSACCWIQILLNATTALGCAQFNTYLGPLRPFFLSLLLYLTFTTRHHVTPASMVLRWSIALLPEALHLWNTTRLRVWLSSRKNNKSPVNGSKLNNPSESSSSAAQAVPTVDVAVYLECPTMGCVACVQSVNSSLQKALTAGNSGVNQIQSVDSWLFEGDRKGGKAKVKFSMAQTHAMKQGKDQVDPKILSSLTGALRKAGFQCTIDVVRTSTRV